MNIDFTNYKTTPLILTIVGLWFASNWCLSYLWGNNIFQGVAPTTIVILFFSFYDKYLWKFPIFKWLVYIDNLTGEYKGKIKYKWNGGVQEKDCVLKIQQTSSRIKIDAYFSKENESNTNSESQQAFFDIDDFGNHSLYFYYKNFGSQINDDQLDNQHNGVCVLEIKDNILDGHYFTNRNPQTKGKMIVQKEMGIK